MPLPTGQISVSQINTEVGATATTQATLQYLNGLIKPAQRPAQPNMDAFRAKSWYQRNTDGACNNGNCTTGNCNCGDINCVNCFNTALGNCVNCDTQNWLQTDCNCACTYNCTSNQWSTNCDCDCACDCACA